MIKWLLIGFVLIGIIMVGLLDPAVHPFPRCPFLTLTGYQCPGCGSQRSLHQLMHGNVLASLKLNPLLLPAVVYAGVGYLSPVIFKNSYSTVRKFWFGRYAAYAIVVIIVLFWVFRNLLK